MPRSNRNQQRRAKALAEKTGDGYQKSLERIREADAAQPGDITRSLFEVRSDRPSAGTVPIGVIDGRQVAMPTVALRKGLHVTGVTGAGKTVLLRNIIRGLAKDGQGMVIIDTHGELEREVAWVADNIPARRRDIVHLNFADPARTVAFNPLDCQVPGTDDAGAQEAFLHALRHALLIGPETTPTAVRYAAIVMRALWQANASVFAERRDQQMTLMDIPRFFLDDRLRAELFARCGQLNVLRDVWELFGPAGTYEQLGENTLLMHVMPILRMWDAIGRERCPFRTSRSSVNFEAWHQQHKIVVVQLNQDRAGSAMTATMLVSMAAQAARRMPAAQRPFLICDETQPISGALLVDIMNGAMATITTGQQIVDKPQTFRDALRRDVASHVLLRTEPGGAAEAALALLAGEPTPTPQQLAALPAGRGWANLLGRHGRRTGPVQLAIPPMRSDDGHPLAAEFSEPLSIPADRALAEATARHDRMLDLLIGA